MTFVWDNLKAKREYIQRWDGDNMAMLLKFSAKKSSEMGESDVLLHQIVETITAQD